MSGIMVSRLHTGMLTSLLIVEGLVDWIGRLPL